MNFFSSLLSNDNSDNKQDQMQSSVCRCIVAAPVRVFPLVSLLLDHGTSRDRKVGRYRGIFQGFLLFLQFSE